MVISNHVFNFLRANVRRIDNNRVLKVCLSFIKNNLGRYKDDVLGLVRWVDFSKVSCKYQEEILKAVINIAQDEELRCNYASLEECIVTLRRNLNIDTSILDNCVETYLSNFYRTTYSLEVFKQTEASVYEYLDHFVKRINQRNLEQGRGQNFCIYG